MSEVCLGIGTSQMPSNGTLSSRILMCLLLFSHEIPVEIMSRVLSCMMFIKTGAVEGESRARKLVGALQLRSLISQLPLVCWSFKQPYSPH